MAFSLAIIVILGLIADYIFRKVKLPGLVGMIIVGIFVGPYVLGLICPEMMQVSADFRKIALIVILLRAGFELHKDTLYRVGRSALLLSAIPAIFEIIGVTLVAPIWLGISYIEAAILGAILGAVSPAVVVPLMIDFMDRGRGARKGIPTLILAASSIDDVFVIVIFSILLGMYTQHSMNIAASLLNIPTSILLGVISGLVCGYILYKIFVKYDWKAPKRTLVVLGLAILLTWLEDATKKTGIHFASLLGVMAIGFMILDKAEPIAHIISQKLKKLWIFAEILLFVLVGSQVNIHVAWKAGLAGAAVIAVGLVFRSVGTYICLLGTDLDWRERLFCIVAYIPKATVQAAIGSVPLEAGVASGEIILAVAVLSILITAPLGAIGIMVLGERILDYGEEMAVYRFRDLREKLGLPRVGERVRHKRFNTVWKVIEEREMWHRTTNSDTGEVVLIPVIYMRFWCKETASGPGTGKTMDWRYSPASPSFDAYWEILYDW